MTLADGDLWNAYKMTPSNATTHVDQPAQNEGLRQRDIQRISVQSATAFGGIVLDQQPPGPQEGLVSSVDSNLNEIIERSIEDHLEIWKELAKE